MVFCRKGFEKTEGNMRAPCFGAFFYVVIPWTWFWLGREISELLQIVVTIQTGHWTVTRVHTKRGKNAFWRPHVSQNRIETRFWLRGRGCLNCYEDFVTVSPPPEFFTAADTQKPQTAVLRKAVQGNILIALVWIRKKRGNVSGRQRVKLNLPICMWRWK